jgi:hypothetical protein
VASDSKGAPLDSLSGAVNPQPQKPKTGKPAEHSRDARTPSLAQLPFSGWKQRSTNRWQHRLKREHPTGTERRQSLNEECGWKGGDSAENKSCLTKTKNPLDSDRSSHGRRLHSEPRSMSVIAISQQLRPAVCTLDRLRECQENCCSRAMKFCSFWEGISRRTSLTNPGKLK